MQKYTKDAFACQILMFYRPKHTDWPGEGWV